MEQAELIHQEGGHRLPQQAQRNHCRNAYAAGVGRVVADDRDHADRTAEEHARLKAAHREHALPAHERNQRGGHNPHRMDHDCGKIRPICI